MRTTLTLDDEVQAKLEMEARRQGRSLEDVVNHYLRIALNYRRSASPDKPFVVKARPMELRPCFTLKNIGELLEQVEGPLHR